MVVTAAREAVSDQKRSIEIRDLRIKQTEDRLLEVSKERDKALDSNEAWYKSPYLYLTLGLILGIATVKAVN